MAASSETRITFDLQYRGDAGRIALRGVHQPPVRRRCSEFDAAEDNSSRDEGIDDANAQAS